METGKAEFYKMLENCEKKPMYWQNTMFPVKKVNGKYYILDKFHNILKEFLDENGVILFHYFYQDFFN